VLDYPEAREIMTLSTNVVYLMAVHAIIDMGARLGQPDAALDALRGKADRLAVAIDEHLADGDSYGYFVHGAGSAAGGTLDHHREAAGLALAVVSGLVPADRAPAVLASIGRGPAGVVSVAPHFVDRYSDDHPGRHNAICWPMIMGLVGLAHATIGDRAGVLATIDDMRAQVEASGGRFDELYDAVTGQPHGGWQCGYEWPSEPDQTWSATSFLRLVHRGLLGIVPTPDGLRVDPLPLEPGETIEVTGLPYRDATVRIVVTAGAERRVLLDGTDVTDGEWSLPADAVGDHLLEVTTAP
jgi:hypothetical protein